GLTAAFALDGTRSPANVAPAFGGVAPQGALASGCSSLRSSFLARQLGGIEAAQKSLEDLARNGDVVAALEPCPTYCHAHGCKAERSARFRVFPAPCRLPCR